MDEVLLQITQLKEQLSVIGIQSKNILNAEEAAKFLGLSKSYIYQMCQRSLIPHFRSKGGKVIYFKRTDLEGWMLGQRVKTQEEINAEALKRVALA